MRRLMICLLAMIIAGFSVMFAAGTSAAAPEPKRIFYVGNDEGVANGGEPPWFTINSATRITDIMTYHWNLGRGKSPGTVGLRSAGGTIYGPWQMSGRPGQGGIPDAYWIATPDTVLPAGRYQVVDSDPTTWAQNSSSNGLGMVEIKGMAADTPSGSPTPLDTPGALSKIQELAEQGHYRQALDMAAGLTEKDPENADAWRSRAMAKRMLGDFSGSLSDYNRAMELNPKNARAWNGRALTKVSLKDLQGALSDVDRSLILDPGYHAGLDSRAKIRMDLKDFQSALADESRAIELAPKVSNYWVLRGNIRREMGDANGAERDYTEALALNPRNSYAYYNRGLARLNVKRYEDAIEDNNQALITGYPNQTDLYNNRGLAYQGKGAVTEAIKDFEKAISLNPGYSKAVSNLAKLRGTDPVAESTSVASRQQTTPTTVGSATSQPAGSTGGRQPAPAGIKVSGLSTRLPVLSKPDEDTLWNKPSPGRFSTEAEGAAIKLASVPPLTEKTNRLQLGDISLTLEGLRHLTGTMTPEEEKQFLTKWQPYFDFPFPESVEYFKKATPILSELQATRALVARVAQDFDASWSDAVAAHAVGDTDGAVAALKSAHRHAKVLKSSYVKLANIAKQVEGMGNPPNPVEAKKKAKARFMKYLTVRGRIAYLWRVAQCVADSFNKSLTLSLSEVITVDKPAKPDKTYKQAYPDERPWIEWLEAGKKGTEPVTYTRPPDEIAREANELVTQLVGGYWVPALWEGHGFEFHPERVAQDKIFHETLPEKAAQAYLEGKLLYTPKQPPPAKPSPSKSVDPATQAKNDEAKKKAEQEAKKRAEEEARIKADAIAEKETWIAIIQKNLAKDQAEYDREANKDRKAELAGRIRNNLSEIQHEKDLLRYLQTGDSIHTRTISDQYCSDLMALRTEEQIKQLEETRRNAELAHKLQVESAERIQETLGGMTNRGDPEQIAKLKDFVERNLTETDIAQGNVEKARKVAQAVFDSVQGYQQGQAATQGSRAIAFEEMETGSRRIQTGASVAMVLTGLGAPAYFAATAGVAGAASSMTALTITNAVYGFGTGAAEGGLVEGVRQAVAQSSLPGMVASEFIEGFSKGGLMTRGGLAGAAERAIETILAGKLIESAAGKMGALYSKNSKQGGRAAAAPENPPMTVQEALESKAFARIKADAHLDKQRLADVNQQIRTAKTRGDVKEVERLGLEKTGMIEKMNDSFYTKRLLKADGKNARVGKGNPADAQLEKDFADTMDKAYREKVNPEFKKQLADPNVDYHWEKMKVGSGKWERAGQVEFKEFRHSGAENTINTDHDFGVKEMSNTEGVVYRLFRGKKPVGVQSKGEKPFNLEDATEELQGIYEKVYRNKLKGDPKKAMQQITCSRSGDAYKDLIVTKLTEDAQNFTKINKGWIEQAAEVSAHKVGGGAGKGVEQTLLKKIDAANQTAKDVEKRLIPMLKSIKAPAEDITCFEQIQKTLSEVEKDPVGASRKLKLLTGCDSISEVCSIVSKKFVGAGKLGNLPTK